MVGGDGGCGGAVCAVHVPHGRGTNSESRATAEGVRAARAEVPGAVERVPRRGVAADVLGGDPHAQRGRAREGAAGQKEGWWVMEPKCLICGKLVSECGCDPKDREIAQARHENAMLLDAIKGWRAALAAANERARVLAEEVKAWRAVNDTCKDEQFAVLNSRMQDAFDARDATDAAVRKYEELRSNACGGSSERGSEQVSSASSPVPVTPGDAAAPAVDPRRLTDGELWEAYLSAWRSNMTPNNVPPELGEQGVKRLRAVANAQLAKAAADNAAWSVGVEDELT